MVQFIEQQDRSSWRSAGHFMDVPKEHFIKFSNMGQATLQELYQI